MVYIGDRLHDFKILIGNEFIMGVTGPQDIVSWSECAYISGKQDPTSVLYFYLHKNTTCNEFRQLLLS